MVPLVEKEGSKINLLDNYTYKIYSRILKSSKSRKVKVVQGETLLSSLTPIPKVENPDFRIEKIYKINYPYTFARILFDTKNFEYYYEAIEPPLSSKLSAILKEVYSSLNQTLKFEWYLKTQAEKEQYLTESVRKFIESRMIKVSDMDLERIFYYVKRDFIKYQKIDPLINDENVEDISCDGVNIPIYIYHREYDSIKTNITFNDDNELNSFIVYIGQKCMKQISVSDPILDGTTPEGHRVQATYSREVTTRGGTFTIRRFKEKPFTPTDLIKYGTASPEMVAYLWLGVELGESMIVIGGPASGKTSTLNSIAIFIPPASKIVSIEDTREINLPHQNWIPGTTRSGVGEKSIAGKASGEIDMYDLVRAALRQRPRYIIVGEVRGKETYTMFQAMATGHTTYSTMHAESVKAMVNRLENPPIGTPRILMTALNNVIIQTQVKVKDELVRRIKEIVEIVGFEPETNELITNVVFEWDPKKDRFIFKGHSYLFDKIINLKNWMHDDMDQEFERRINVIKYLDKKNITDFRDIWKIITDYYRDPKETMERIMKDLSQENE
ncbi:MAG: type II/IV secretion system ATPase subunit [Thermoplasmata archaeon]|nr:type II/IV secretion system ATPase subunit [Thermoplasmata archaeon]